MSLNMLIGRIPIDSGRVCICYNLIKMKIDIIWYKFNI